MVPLVRAFRNLSIGKKLNIGFMAVLAVLVTLSVISYQNFSKTSKAMDWNKHTYEVLMGLQTVLDSMVNMETGQRGFALTGNENSLEPYVSGKASFEQSFNHVKELTSDNPYQQELMNKIQNVHQEWLQIAENNIQLRRNVSKGIGSMDDVVKEEQAAKGKAAFDEFRAIIAESSGIESKLLLERSLEAERVESMTKTSIIAGSAAAVVLSLLIALIITRLITRPIFEVKQAAEQVADGNLDVMVQVHSKDEIGALSEAFRIMVHNMNDVLANINTAAEQVSSGSRQVSETSMSLSQGATEQASSVEQLTASLEEIATQTKQNADNATEANVLVETAKENAVQGNTQMKEMLGAMDDINKASESISKIIKVIDEIAFQTNILALNAAVEAARAGQHGKGFAVVAEEVRNLAARSANAAKETTEMIEGSIRKVQDGTKIANETASALQHIVEDVAKVAELVNEIAIASNEQASGVNQINLGLMQVSQVVQANSATSEESAAASEELSDQAELLREQVGRFKIKSQSPPAYREHGQLNPEVMRLLDSMSEKKRMQVFTEDGDPAAAGTAPRKIMLSDHDFGKY